MEPTSLEITKDLFLWDAKLMSYQMVEDIIVLITSINKYKQKKYSSTWREKMKPGQWIAQMII
jgi:hypothetical protein